MHPLRTMNKRFILVVIVFLFMAFLAIIVFFPNVNPPTSTRNYTYKIINTYPHNTSAFTEGLVFENEVIYESTGSYGGPSTLRRVDLATGIVLQSAILSGEFFGEGLSIVNNTLVQLTWMSQVGFVYDKSSFKLLGNFTYKTEGWGLTFDGKNLVMSDGSDLLYFIEPATFQVVRQVNIRDGNDSLRGLNELEFIKGKVYANIFGSRNIAVINPENGQVDSWINLSGLSGAADTDTEKVLNGIAYDAQNDRLFVTGKNWPKLYEIDLVPLN